MVALVQQLVFMAFGIVRALCMQPIQAGYAVVWTTHLDMLVKHACRLRSLERMTRVAASDHNVACDIILPASCSALPPPAGVPFTVKLLAHQQLRPSSSGSANCTLSCGGDGATSCRHVIRPSPVRRVHRRQCKQRHGGKSLAGDESHVEECVRNYGSESKECGFFRRVTGLCRETNPVPARS